MSKEPNNIDRLVREKLDGFEMSPPPSVWNATEAAMAKSGSKKRFLLWFFLGTAVLTFLTVGVYYFTQEGSTKTQLAKENTSPSSMNTKTGKSSLRNNQTEKTSIDLKEELLNSSNEDIDTASNLRYNNQHFQSSFVNNSSSQKRDMATDFGSTNGNSPINSTDVSSPTGTQSNSKTSFNTNQLSKKSTVANAKSAASTAINQGNSNSPGDGNLQSEKSIGENSNSTSSGARNESSSSNESNSSKQHSIQTNESAQVYSDFSLPTYPIELLKPEQQDPISSQLGSRPIQTQTPFWKAFSIEASMGMSAFSHLPKNVTPEFLVLLNNATSQRLSLDFRFGLNYQLTNQWSIQSGLEYNRSQENYLYEVAEMTTFQYPDTISSSLDSITGDTTYVIVNITDTTTAYVAKNSPNFYRTLTIPFHFAWTKNIGIRSELEIALEGALSIYGKNTGSTILDSSGSVISSEQAYRTKSILSVGGSIKYLHHFGYHHAIYIQPWVRFGVTSQSTTSLNYESFRRRYGVRLGYRFYF